MRLALEKFWDKMDDLTVLLEPEWMDEAIVAVENHKVVYDYDKLIDGFIKHDDMTFDDAVEWLEYVTIRALSYMGDFAPIIR